MDVNAITGIISSVGFPIVACGALFYMVREITASHKQEIESLRKTIEENTQVLTRLESIIKMLDRREA